MPNTERAHILKTHRLASQEYFYYNIRYFQLYVYIVILPVRLYTIFPIILCYIILYIYIYIYTYTVIRRKLAGLARVPFLSLSSLAEASTSSNMLYYTILYCTILYYTILYYTILYYTILYYTILYYTILHYTILYYTILYYTILYYSILYYNMY